MEEWYDQIYIFRNYSGCRVENRWEGDKSKVMKTNWEDIAAVIQVRNGGWTKAVLARVERSAL